MRRIAITAALVGGLALAAGTRANAAENYAGFLRALQAKGYGDMAVEYLRLIEKRPDLPQDLKETIDLEVANSLRSAAASAYNADEAAKLLTEAQQRFDKFEKEKPTHPALAGASALWGSIPFERAETLVRQAKLTEDAAQFADARKFLQEAKTRYVKAEAGFREQFQAKTKEIAERRAKKTPPKSKTKPGKVARDPAQDEADQLEVDWIIAWARLGQIEYYMAQTHPIAKTKAKDQPRLTHLKAAAKIFSEIFQNQRDSQFGVLAHLWHAKCLFELGSHDLALDITDEVLANAPSEIRGAGDIDGMFVDAQLLRFKILVAKAKDDDEQKEAAMQAAMQEAEEWVKQYAALQNRPVYQPIALELAKMYIAHAETLQGNPKHKRQQDAMKLLTGIARVSSNVQQEAVLLRRDLLKTLSKPGAPGTKPKSTDEANNFAEAMALGNTAADSEDWAAALAHYRKAIELAAKEKVSPKERQDLAKTAQERVTWVEFFIAVGHVGEKQHLEAFTLADKIAREQPTHKFALRAGSMAVFSARTLFGEVRQDAKARVPALERLKATADYLQKTWPDAPEADDARMVLASVEADDGRFDKAIGMFLQVNPKSPRYADALLYAGQTEWRRYRLEKVKPQAKRDAEGMATWRASAEKSVRKSLELRPDTDVEEAVAQKADTQLLLGDICLEGGQFADAIKQYQPLVDKLAAEPPPQLEPAQLRLFASTVRAYVNVEDAAKAADVALKLAKISGDTPPANGVLLEAARAWDTKLKAAQGKETSARADGKKPEEAAAAAEITQAKAALGTVLDPLATRKQLAPRSLIYIGTLCVRAGKKEQARDVFRRVLEQADKDPEFAKQFAPNVTSVRGQLVGMLRDEGKFEEALKQLDALLQANPKSLDLLMQRGRTLQSWSKQDAKHYPDAVAQWAKLRVMLEPMRQKPDEYFEVVYNTAECLLHDARLTQDPKKSEIAGQLLRVTLVRFPQLSGPDMIANYQVLLKQLAKPLGPPPEGSKDAAKEEGETPAAAKTE